MTAKMGAFCIACGTKNMSGFQSGAQLLKRYPTGCHACSHGTEGTRTALKEMIEEHGYAFVDMEGEPIIVRELPKYREENK